jgi:hypothetical protein
LAKIKPIEYTGIFFCPNVSTGAFIARRNGKIFITGNTGKDSVIDISSSLFGGCGTVESPTIAKLEDRASVLKLLVVNEVVDIKKEDWDNIQQFLLTAGAHKNEVTKHSRAFQNVKEIIDVKDFSLSIYFNDISCYPKPEKYFDAVTKEAVKDRFPSFRFWGRYTEDFNSLKNVDVKSYVNARIEQIKELIYNYTYYKNNFRNYTHNYKQDSLMKFSGRDAVNMGRLLKVIDFYCESQKEFDEWMNVINDSMEDYIVMLEYPNLLTKLKETSEKKYSEKEFEIILKDLDNKRTFVDKVRKLKDLLQEKKST